MLGPTSAAPCISGFAGRFCHVSWVMNDVCVCNSVTEEDIRQAAAAGVRSFEELQCLTGCSGGCGGCEQEVRQLLSDIVAAITYPHPTAHLRPSPKAQ
jgi:bacterioferritin-associated ferredoxin